MISRPPVTIEVTPRLDVMHIKHFCQLFLCETAPLTSKVVTFTASKRNLIPIGTTVITMPTKPCRTLWPRGITRLPLPLKATLDVAKRVFAPNHTFQTMKWFTAIITDIFCTLYILRMFLPLNSMHLPPIRFALFGAKGIGKLLQASNVPHNYDAAIRTRHLSASCTGRITAMNRTIPLFNMIVRHDESFLTNGAFTFSDNYQGLGRTFTGTKCHISVGAFY